MEIVLKTENLTKRFREKSAVNRVNMTIARGDIYGFIGKNGAGKTTTMKLVLGLTFPDAGKINSLLVKSGMEVRELSMQHGGFEDYFIGRLGR